MNQKISRNEKHKCSNEEKLSLLELGNINALIYIAQVDQSKVFELLQNLGMNIVRFIILKCYRFCLNVTFVLILLLLYSQMFLKLWFLWLDKGKKKII